MTEQSSHLRAAVAPQIGATAPDLKLPDETGQIHSLADGLGKNKPIVLIFMRGEW